MNVQIELKTTREAEGDTEQTQLLLQGTFEPGKDGGVITYRNTGEGMEGVVTAVTADARRVIIENRGAMTSRLVLEPGKRHRCDYDTGFGVTVLETAEVTVQNRLTEPCRTLLCTYTLTAGGGQSRHTLALLLRPVIG